MGWLIIPFLKIEPCPGLMDYVIIWIEEPFIKNEKSTIDNLIFLSKQNIIVPLILLDINEQNDAFT